MRAVFSPSLEGRQSSGLASDASAGRMARSRSWLRSESGGSSKPCRVSSSASSTPGPPALLTMQARRPASGPRAASSAQPTSSISSRLPTRMMPALRKRASTAVSGVAMAPVWLAAARTPAPVTPDLIATSVQPLRVRLRAWRRSLPGLSSRST